MGGLVAPTLGELLGLGVGVDKRKIICVNGEHGICNNIKIRQLISLFYRS